jgi:hypothetical protein
MPALIPAALLVGSAGITIGGISLSASLVQNVVVTALLVGASLALGGQRPPVQRPADGSQPLRQRVPARIAAFGTEVRVPARYMLYALTDKGASVDVLAHCEGPITAILKRYLHDDEVTLDAGGIVLGLDDGRYGDAKIQIVSRLGAPAETAYAEVLALVPDMGGVEWTADHRGDGIHSSALICKSVGAEGFQKRYPHGLPQLSNVINALKVPALGAISDNPATWLPSDNPLLQAARFVTDAHVGMGAPWDLLIAPGIAELEVRAARCDELVLKKDATLEPRFRHRNWYQLDSNPIEVLAGMLESCDGWIAQGRHGALAMIPGVYEAPDDDAQLDDADILGVSTLDYGVSDAGRIDELEITFQSPLHDYKIIDGEPWVAPPAPTTRGVPRHQPLALPGVPSFSQARRLAKLFEQRANAPLRGTLICTWSAIRCAGKRWVHVAYSEIDELADAIVEVRRMRKDFIRNVIELEFVLIDPDTFFAWDPATEEGTAPRLPVKPGRLTDLPVPQDVSVTITGNDADGFSFRIEFPNPGRDGLHYVVRYQLIDDGTGNPGPWVEQEVQGNFDNVDPVVLATPIVHTGVGYVVQVASVATKDTRSDWSEPVVVYSAMPQLDFHIPQNSMYLGML